MPARTRLHVASLAVLAAYDLGAIFVRDFLDFLATGCPGKNTKSRNREKTKHTHV